MKLETRYGLNEQVVLIANRREKQDVTCSACKGRGKVFLDGAIFECVAPRCHGVGTYVDWLPTKWLVTRRLTIGLVRLSVSTDVDEEYMAVETGIGTGSVYRVADLCATAEAAQAECDRRNANVMEE